MWFHPLSTFFLLPYLTECAVSEKKEEETSFFGGERDGWRHGPLGQAEEEEEEEDVLARAFGWRKSWESKSLNAIPIAFPLHFFILEHACTDGKKLFLKPFFRRNIKQWFASLFCVPFFPPPFGKMTVPPSAGLDERKGAEGRPVPSTPMKRRRRRRRDRDTEEEGNEFSFLALRPTLHYCIVLHCTPLPLHFLQCRAFI